MPQTLERPAPVEQDFLPLNGTDHIEFLVGNARQAAHFYRTAFGFRLAAYRGPETGTRDRASYVLVQNKIRLVLTTAFDPASLEHLVLTSMSVADRPRSKLVLVKSLLGRHLFAFVWLPRDEVSAGRREAIGEMLAQASSARIINSSIALEDGVVALLRYTLDLREGGTMPDADALDRQLERIGALPNFGHCVSTS